MVALEDVGGFTALVLARPQEYLGRTVDLAGDKSTEAQMAETLTRVIGRPVHCRTASRARPAVTEEQLAFNRFLNSEGYSADIQALRRVYPELLTLERFLRQHGWEMYAQCPVLPQDPVA